MLSAIDGVEVLDPLGAFYAFPNVSGTFNNRITTSDDLATYLIDEAQVVTVPGSAFGRDGFLRISFAVKLNRLQEALHRISEALSAIVV